MAPRALTGTVVAFKGAFGFVEYVRGDERPRVFFAASDAEQNLAPPLRHFVARRMIWGARAWL